MKRIVEYNGHLEDVNSIKEGLAYVQKEYLRLVEVNKPKRIPTCGWCYISNISNHFGKPVHHRCYAVNKKGVFIRREVSDVIDDFLCN